MRLSARGCRRLIATSRQPNAGAGEDGDVVLDRETCLCIYMLKDVPFHWSTDSYLGVLVGDQLLHTRCAVFEQSDEAQRCKIDDSLSLSREEI